MSTRRRYALGMAHRELGRDPAADAGTGDVDLVETERIHRLDIAEGEIVHGLDVVVLVRAGAAGMRRRDHGAKALRERVVERQESRRRAVHVGEAVQIEERRTVSGLGDLDRVAGDGDRAGSWLRSFRGTGDRRVGELGIVAREQRRGIRAAAPARPRSRRAACFCAQGRRACCRNGTG